MILDAKQPIEIIGDRLLTKTPIDLKDNLNFLRTLRVLGDCWGLSDWSLGDGGGMVEIIPVQHNFSSYNHKPHGSQVC